MAAPRTAGVRGAKAVSGHYAIVHGFTPPGFEIGAGVLRRPVGLDEIVGAPLRLIGEHLEDLDGGAPVIQRLDERLLDGHGAVEGAGIAPGFEVMGLGKVPLAQLGGLVVVEAEVHADAGLGDLVAHAPLDGGVERGIAAEDEEQIDAAGFEILHQIAERGDLIDRIGLDGIACRRPSCPRCRGKRS